MADSPPSCQSCRASASRAAQPTGNQAASSRHVAQLRKAALPLLRDAAAASHSDVVLKMALQTLEGKGADKPGAKDVALDDDPGIPHGLE